jgi:hypothetical protein
MTALTHPTFAIAFGLEGWTVGVRGKGHHPATRICVRCLLLDGQRSPVLFVGEGNERAEPFLRHARLASLAEQPVRRGGVAREVSVTVGLSNQEDLALIGAAGRRSRSIGPSRLLRRFRWDGTAVVTSTPHERRQDSAGDDERKSTRHRNSMVH